MVSPKKIKVLTSRDIFDEIKKDIAVLDPVSFAEHNLTIDGKPFDLSGSGWKYMAEIYRTVSAQVENKEAKPIILLKGRQVGATIMAGVLSLHMGSSGLYGAESSKPPIRVMHVFPDLKRCGVYAKDILATLISGSKDNYISKRALKVARVVDLEDTQTQKNFIGMNKVRVDSIGKSGDRIRGSTQDVLLFDECISGSEYIEVEGGKKTIRTLYRNWKKGRPNPKIMSYDIENDVFEYQDLVHAWEHAPRDVVLVKMGNRKITCTPDHPFLTTNGYVQAKDLKPGSLIITKPSVPQFGPDNKQAHAAHTVTAVDEVIPQEKKQQVYDIEVKKNHNFIVTSRHSSKKLGGVVLKNCQDMTRSAIENTLKVLTATPYGAPTKGVQVFFGTPKHSGSYFWTLWEESDQRFYQLRCKHCDHYFFLYNLDNDDWNDTWIKENLIKCPSCLKTQDKRESVDLGRWIPTRPTNAKGEPQKFIGYHFNMMLSPLFTKENVLDYWPTHNKNASERAWRNETKGQFYSASEVPITLEEVYAHALDESRGVAKSITNPAGKNFFLGMDWGEKVESDEDLEVKRGKSFTCAVILSVDHTGTLTIENAVRLKKNDPDYKMNVVRKLMSDFHIDQAAADFYYGNDFVRLVQHNEGLKDKFLGCTNLSNSKRAFSYDAKDLMVGINKDQVLDEIFALFKRGKIKIPAKGDSLELLGWLVDHITSMETHTKTKDGIVLKTYKKGVVQNDGLMALMYAYTAYKFMVTRKFTEQKIDGVNKKKQDDIVVPIVGYIPRMH
jgi:hypothetical protein